MVDSSANMEEMVIKHYNESLEDAERELIFLDSLKSRNIISEVDYKYRKAALAGLMEEHKKNKIVRKWASGKDRDYNDGYLKMKYSFNLSKTDSLLKFSFFRTHLKNISRYGLHSIDTIPQFV